MIAWIDLAVPLCGRDWQPVTKVADECIPLGERSGPARWRCQHPQVAPCVGVEDVDGNPASLVLGVQIAAVLGGLIGVAACAVQAKFPNNRGLLISRASKARGLPKRQRTLADRRDEKRVPAKQPSGCTREEKGKGGREGERGGGALQYTRPLLSDRPYPTGMNFGFGVIGAIELSLIWMLYTSRTSTEASPSGAGPSKTVASLPTNAYPTLV